MEQVKSATASRAATARERTSGTQESVSPTGGTLRSARVRRLGGIGARVSAVALTAVALGVAAAPATAAPGTSPDGSRGYELVSAGDKNSDGVLGGGGFNTGAPLLSRDGDHAVFPSLTAFIGANTAPFFQTYGARRTGDGWAMKALVPAPPAGSTGTIATGGDWNVIGWTADFQTEFGIAYNASWDPDDRSGEPGTDLYASDGSALPSWISRGSGPKLTPDSTTFEGSSTDGRYVAFRTSGKLDPRESDPATGRQSGEGLYLRDREAGTTTLVGVGNDGNLLNRCGTGGASGNSSLAGNGAVTDDARKIFFQAGFTYGNAGACTASDVNGQIFVREDGEKTVLVSPRRRTVPDPAGRQVPSWRGATPSGNAVVFSSGELLTDDAQATNALYRFELPTAAHPDGVLTDLTPKVFGGTSLDQYGAVAISRDGSVVSFASSSALTADAPVDGSTKLYVHSGGQLRLVGVVAPGAQDVPRVDDATLALSPDGSKLAFVAVEPQAGAPDHAGTTQVYVATTAGGTPSCVSCGTSGVPTGAANLGPSLGRLAATGRNTRNPVTDDGQVAFQTPTALLRTDTNNRSDVYVRRPDGSVALITTGRASADAELVGASDDGRSVAFVTTETLTWDDVDNGDADVYIARTGGGFAAPAAPAGCDGDVCQGQPTPQAAPDRAASAFVVGPGNVVPPKDEVGGGSSKLTVQAVTARERRSFAAGKRLDLRLRVTRGGTATVTAKARIGKQTRTVARASQRKQSAGTIKLGLRLSKAARRELTRTGRLRVTITVRHTGAPSRTTALTLTTKKGR